MSCKLDFSGNTEYFRDVFFLLDRYGSGEHFAMEQNIASALVSAVGTKSEQYEENMRVLIVRIFFPTALARALAIFFVEHQIVLQIYIYPTKKKHVTKIFSIP
jgi:hypothetical protein